MVSFIHALYLFLVFIYTYLASIPLFIIALIQAPSLVFYALPPPLLALATVIDTYVLIKWFGSIKGGVLAYLTGFTEVSIFLFITHMEPHMHEVRTILTLVDIVTAGTLIVIPLFALIIIPAVLKIVEFVRGW